MKEGSGVEREGYKRGGGGGGKGAGMRSHQLCLIRRQKVRQEQRRQTDETKTLNNKYGVPPSAAQ